MILPNFKNRGCEQWKTTALNPFQPDCSDAGLLVSSGSTNRNATSCRSIIDAANPYIDIYRIQPGSSWKALKQMRL